MIESNNQIIIVDNEPEELYNLGKMFLNLGLPCRTFEYDQFYKDPLNNVRIAFFDIKLNPAGGGSKEQEFSTLADALKLYINIENPPYLLVFWTSNQGLIDQFISYVSSRDSEIPVPFSVSCIDKVEVSGSDEILKKKIVDILNNSMINVLFDFEAKVSNAASKTINRFFNIIPYDKLWSNDSSFFSGFDAVFSKLASRSLGFKHAKEHPSKAMYETLLPILNHDFLMDNTTDNWAAVLTLLKSAKRDDDLIYPDDFNQGLLNTIFHIDSNTEFSKDHRGVVIALDQNAFFSTFFKMPYAKWFNLFLPGLKKNTRNESKLVAIEISASCDFSQKKPRTNKYILGVIFDSVYFNDLNKDKLPQYLLILDGEYLLKDRSCRICINLNYTFSASLDAEIISGSVLFALKKEMIDMIGNRYANHVSRIGITSF